MFFGLLGPVIAKYLPQIVNWAKSGVQIIVAPCSAERPCAAMTGSSGALVVGNGFGYRMSADGGERRVAVSVRVRGAEAQGESPAATACPGGPR